MSGPLIFVSHSTVKDGKAEEYAKHIRRAAELVDSEEPRMIGFLCYASDDGTEVSTVQVHPDAESLDTHMRVFTENLQSLALESLDTSEINVYGEPSDSARAGSWPSTRAWCRACASGSSRFTKPGSCAHSPCDAQCTRLRTPSRYGRP